MFVVRGFQLGSFFLSPIALSLHWSNDIDNSIKI